MAQGSSIEWTEATWNPVTGCTKISQGCKHCYAERMAKRLRQQAFAEMTDAEEIMDRILFFDGLPNFQRFDGFAVGETVAEPQ